MPPKAKKAAASAPPASGALPLDGCVIAFSGRFTGYRQSVLEDKVANLGAQPAKSVTADTTHCVTTQADFDKLCTKVWQAKDRGIFIVSLEWLLDSEQSNAKQPEAQYLFVSPQNGSTNGSTNGNNTVVTSTNPATQPPTVNNNVPAKRQASPIVIGSSPEPKLKKTKLDQVAQNGKAAAIGKEQIAKSWDVQVPVDEGCSLAGYGVHVDDDSVIWDASLNQTNAGLNNNKFYRIQVLVSAGDAKTWTRWGRVGDRGQSKILGNGSLLDAKSQFEKKFREKSGLSWANRMDEPLPKKYVFLEKSYQPDSDSEEDVKPSGEKGAAREGPPPCTLEPEVQELMQLIFNQKYFAAAMEDMNYDLNKLPLGKLSKATIMRGFQTLKDLSVAMNNPAAAAAAAGGNSMSVEDLSNRYYSLIPHNFGRNRPPIINDQNTVKREIELLETLADMKDASNILKAEIDERNTLHPLDRQYRGLGMEEMTALDPNGTEFKHLKDYLVNTRGHTHAVNYSVQNIFRIERQGEKNRFITDNIADRRLLWHGSRATNFGGILSQGLRIAPPEAPMTGYMFDKGIYLADMSSKSINYCVPSISEGTALLLLCEAELGKPMQELTNAEYNAATHAKAKGVWSTFGKGMTGPPVWKDAECVHSSLGGIKMPDTSKKLPGPTNVPGAYLQYNEYIAYDVSQIRLRYLFRVKV